LGSAPSGQESDHIPAAGRHVVRWAVIVCIATFGPYAAGVLTGQLALVLGGMFIILTGWSLAVRSRFPLLPVIGLWLAICAITMVAGAWRSADPGFYGTLPALHSLWWLVMPQLVVAITWYWTRYARPELLLLAVARVIAIAMTVNSVLAVVQLSMSTVNLGGALSNFWSSASGGVQSVAQLAAENGRYSGIFNQPAEAGTAYGVALLCIIYLVRRGARWQVADAAALLVVAGGVLSISKVFLFIALPVAAWVVISSSGIRLRMLTGAAIGVAALIVAGFFGLLPAWGGGRSGLQFFLHPTGSFASVYTADRYGQGGTLGAVTADVLHTSPWAGFGASGLNTPYDSLWLEILVISGILGVACMCAILAVLGWCWLQARKLAAPAESMLAGSVLTLAVMSSAGFPSLTADRAGILIWLILGIFLNGCESEQVYV
jgi:hypothetical protein